MGIEKRRSTLSVLFYIKRQKLLKNGEAPGLSLKTWGN